jgi:hypothetical protein
MRNEARGITLELNEARDMLLHSARGLEPPFDWVGVYLSEDHGAEAFLCTPSEARKFGDALLEREWLADEFMQATWAALVTLGDRSRAAPEKLHGVAILADRMSVWALEIDFRVIQQAALC